MRMCHALLGSFALALLACSTVLALPKPKYNEVYRKATHNSYWINSASGWLADPFASGVQERIVDQLLFEHVRALELDLHYEGGHPGEFTVYHTSNATENSSCHYLGDCLQLLQRLDYLQPNHEVVNVILEFKEMFNGPTLGKDHHAQDLDRLLWEPLGSRLYTPREFLSRCAPGATMRACAGANAGWPTVDELRGRYIVNVIGNWADDYYDWITYANDDGGIVNRAAFPIRSMLTSNLHALPGPANPNALGNVDFHPEIEMNGISLQYFGKPNVAALLGDPSFKQRLVTARDASVFWQAEDDNFASHDATRNPTGENTFDFQEAGGVARSHNV